MKCRYCGAAVEPGSLYCSRCGREIRIVPDYNPLDDVLEAQIRGGVDDAARISENRQRTEMRYASGGQERQRTQRETSGSQPRQMTPREAEAKRQAARRKKQERIEKDNSADPDPAWPQ